MQALESQIWALLCENPILLHVNNKGADHPAHNLVSIFVICILESITSKLTTCKLSIVKLVSVAEQAGWKFTEMKDRFKHIQAHIMHCHTNINKIRL